MARDPFAISDSVYQTCSYVDAASRLEAVKSFSKMDCRAALKMPDLQKTVRRAIERRLKRMESCG
jgi:hypothetical protein